MKLLLPAILLVASLALGGAIAYEAVAPLDLVTVETPRLPAHHGQPALPAAYVPPSEDLYADIDQRPLFSMTRRPLTDAVQASGAASAASDFSLVGVIMGGSRAIALLRIRSTSATVSATVGGLVNGWRVARIDATAVTLRGAGGEVLVPLEGPAAQPPSAPLPALAPAPTAAPPVVVPAPSATITPPKPAPATTTPTPPPVAATATRPKPGAPVPHKIDPTISPDALKGVVYDPQTGEPTL